MLLAAYVPSAVHVLTHLILTNTLRYLIPLTPPDNQRKGDTMVK